jgi:hypothetical protein
MNRTSRFASPLGDERDSRQDGISIATWYKWLLDRVTMEASCYPNPHAFASLFSALRFLLYWLLITRLD